jgi:hypothetical protein
MLGPSTEPSPYLKKGTVPVSETSCFVVIQNYGLCTKPTHGELLMIISDNVDFCSEIHLDSEFTSVICLGLKATPQQDAS